VIEALRTSDTELDRKIAFVYADWDEHSNSPIANSLRVPRQSTLIMLTSQGEAGRLVAQTSKQAISDLLQKAPARPADAPACNG
jgi:hypothetical protein